MKNINGQGNEITIILPHKKIDCISSHHEQFNQIIKMNITSTIITASDGTPLSLYDVCRFLSKQQWKHILKQLKQEGIHIERIEAYEYPEVRDIKHLFIRFEKEKEDTPFYLLSPEIFSKLTNAIIQEYSSNIK